MKQKYFQKHWLMLIPLLKIFLDNKPNCKNLSIINPVQFPQQAKNKLKLMVINQQKETDFNHQKFMVSQILSRVILQNNQAALKKQKIQTNYQPCQKKQNDYISLSKYLDINNGNNILFINRAYFTNFVFFIINLVFLMMKKNLILSIMIFFLIKKDKKQNLMNKNPRKQVLEDTLTRAINGQSNWTKHVNHTCCKCQKCICGKHRCEIKSPHLELATSNSTYNNSYIKKRPISLNRVKTESYDIYEPELIVQKSLYKQQFNEKARGIFKVNYQIRPDNIQTGGPSFNTTTYQRNYTTLVHCEPVGKIINPENLQCSPEAKMNSNSSYRDNYKWYLNRIKKEQPIKPVNNLKTQITSFTTQSRYSMDFYKFNNYKREQSFAPNRSYLQTKGMKTLTSYNDHYSYKQLNICPAKGQK